jgi:membrane fusion protein, multidrug efflux system
MRYAESHQVEIKDNPEVFKVYLTLSDNEPFDKVGKIDFIDRQINPQTGTIAMRAVFANPKGLLKPGNFANVNLVLLERNDGVVIPQSATTQVQGKNFAFVVKADNTVNRLPVVLGRSIDNLYIINDGLKPGDRILLEGFQKFKEGMKINPVPVADTLSVPAEPTGK